MTRAESLREAIEAAAKHLDALGSSVSGDTQGALHQFMDEIANSLEQLKAAEAEVSNGYSDLGREAAKSRHEQQRYRDLFDFSPDGYLVMNSRGVIQEANLIAAQLLNVSPEYLVKKPMVLFIGNDAMRYLLDQSHTTTIENRLDVRTWEAQVQPRAKDPFDAMIRSSLIFDDRGKQLGYRLLIRDISDDKRREAELKSSQEQLRALAARLQEIREEERNNLARELHDEFGAALTTLKLDLVWLKKHLTESPPEIHERIAAMSKLIEMTTEGVRETATMLRPRLLDDFGLLAAIEWQVQDFEKHSGISCGLTAEEVFLPTDCATSVFRILQESLTNVARYAEATRVEIRLKEQDGYVVLCVSDNGKGFPLDSQHTTSLGLVGMRERAYAFGGDFEMDSAPGCGTTVKVRVPYPREKKESDPALVITEPKA